ncbi:MAG: PLP-dependent aminotransferase family protein [Magnetococcales bacterium]|nr:PLP-dependent aminotransferase family protein [Magnetococcales bacterium]
MGTPEKYHYARLADELARRIQEGIYRPDERLPSIRHLSRENALSPTTVHQAFMELEKRGLVEARERSGYFARLPRSEVLPPPRRRSPAGEPRKVVFDAVLAQLLSASEQDSRMVPLGGALLGPAYFPARHFSRLMKSFSPERVARLSGYGPLLGNADLRRHLAQRPLGGHRVVGAEEICITSGCMEAVNLCLRAVTRPGDAVAVESPTFFGFLQVLEDLGLYAVEVPTDPDQGVDPDALARILEDGRVKAGLFIPNHHNPLGACMPSENKRRIVALCTQRGIPLIEDDIYGDLHFPVGRPDTLKAYDEEGLVLYCSSLSKTLAPGLRVGWTMPGRFFQRVVRLRTGSVISSPPLMQQVTADLLESGFYDRHLRRLRMELSNNLRRLSAAVARSFPPGTRMTHPTGGFLLWVELPDGVDGMAVYEEALRQGVAILPGSLCSPSRRYRNCLRLSGGHPWSNELEEGVKRLGEVIGRSRVL